MKKLISAVLIAAMMLSALPLIYASDDIAEASQGDFSDYVATDIPDNLYVNDLGLTHRWLATFEAIHPNHGNGIEGAMRYPIVANPGYWGDSSASAIAGGDMTMCLGGSYSSTDSAYKWKADTTYVVQTDLKNASAEGVGTVRFGYMIDSRDVYGNRCRPYQILEIEPDDEWHTFKFTLHTDNAGDDKANLHYGYPNHSSLHNPQGTEVQHRIGSFYIAEEVAHDIVITGDQTVITEGEEISFSAEVVNQLYTEHSLGSDIYWYVVDADRTSIVGDINMQVSEDGKAVTLSAVDGETEPGTYYLIAEDNTKGIENFRKSIEIRVNSDYNIDDEQEFIQLWQALTSGDIDMVSHAIDYVLSLPELVDSVAQNADRYALAELIVCDEQKGYIESARTREELVQAISKIAALSLYNSNPQGLPLYNADGTFAYEDLLGMSDIDVNDITIYESFCNLASLEGRLRVHELLEERSYNSFAEFMEYAANKMFFCTLAYPNVNGVGYVSELFQSPNLDLVGIDAGLYHRIRNVHELFARIAGSLYDDAHHINDIMQEIYHAQNAPTGGGSGGGGGGTVVTPGGSGGGGTDETHTPTIKVSNELCRVGDIIEVEVSLSGNPGIASMLLELGYDSNYMTLKSVSDGGILGDAVHSNNLALNPYVLTWANDTVTENIESNGIIVTLTFEISEDAPAGEYPLSVSYDEESGIFDVNLEPVSFDIEDGIVSVVDYYFGDVNEDGEVNTLDRAILSRYLAKWIGYDSIHSGAADVNADGNADALDRAILARHLSGWTGYEKLPYKRS